MTMHLFRNRSYRRYFQFMDAFAQPRCPLCVLLFDCDQTAINTFLASPERRQKPETALKALCVLHKIRVKKNIAVDDPSLSIMLKAVVKDSLHVLARPRRHPMAGWWRWFERFRPGCPLCIQLSAQEKSLCRALIRFLGDTEFWKGFSRAPLLCLDHLEKCLTFADEGAEFERLLNDQSAKLNELLYDLIRFEATGTREKCKSTALDWLADFAGPLFDIDDASAFSAALEVAPEPQTPPDLCAVELQDQEQLLFENEKLTRKVRDLLHRLNDVESRAASLHYQVSRLSEDNKRLEMGYTGANAQADGLKHLVRDLRGQIERLKNGVTEQTAKAS